MPNQKAPTPPKVVKTPAQKAAQKAVLDTVAVALVTLDQQASALNAPPVAITEAERIANDYAACLDSANLLIKGKPIDMAAADWAVIVLANKQHLGHKLVSPQWTDEDLSPFITAFNT